MDRMETTPTDASDRPTKDIIINEIVVFVDPFDEFQKQRKEKEDEEVAERERKLAETEDQRTTWTGKRLRGDGKVADEPASLVGKYLHSEKGNEAHEGEIIGEVEEDMYYEEPIKKKPKKGGFGNFDGW